MKCPCCGANLILDKKNDLASCQYCGYEGILSKIAKNNEPSAAVSHPQVNTIKGNLFVTVVPGGFQFPTHFNVLDCGMSFSMNHGETRAFHLEPGVHRISVSAGRSSTIRMIVIPNDDRVVRINISYDPSLAVNIEQPKVEGKYAALQNGLMPSSSGYALAIVSLILASTGFLSFVGFMLAIANLTSKSKRTEKTGALDYVALGISMIAGLFFFLFIAAMGGSGR